MQFHGTVDHRTLSRWYYLWYLCENYQHLLWCDYGHAHLVWLVVYFFIVFTNSAVLSYRYISCGKGKGNPYGLAAVCAVVFPFFFFARLYWPIPPMRNIVFFVTIILVSKSRSFMCNGQWYPFLRCDWTPLPLCRSLDIPIKMNISAFRVLRELDGQSHGYAQKTNVALIVVRYSLPAFRNDSRSSLQVLWLHCTSAPSTAKILLTYDSSY